MKDKLLILIIFVLITIIIAILNVRVQYSYCIDWIEDGQTYTACDFKYIKFIEYLTKEEK